MVFKVKRKKAKKERSPAFERCVKKVKKQKGVNPFAVCQASLGKKAFVKKRKKAKVMKPKTPKGTFKMRNRRERENFVRSREFGGLIRLAIGLGILSAVLRGISATKKTT